MKRGIDSRSIDNLSDRLDRLEAADDPENFSDIEYRYGLTEEEYEELTPMEKGILKFNWYVKQIMPYYKAEVMSVHKLTSEEYDRRVLEGDQSIYLPQPSRKFKPTSYMERVAHVLNLSFQELQEKFKSGALKHLIALGPNNPETGGWCDENPNAVV